MQLCYSLYSIHTGFIQAEDAFVGAESHTYSFQLFLICFACYSHQGKELAGIFFIKRERIIKVFRPSELFYIILSSGRTDSPSASSAQDGSCLALPITGWHLG